MRGCEQQASGVVELYFYDELDGAERAAVARHLSTCAECRQTLDDLGMIRSALSSRPQVDAPERGDWTPFMARLGEALQRAGVREFGASGVRSFERQARVFELPRPRASQLPGSIDPPIPRAPELPILRYVSYLATAALLTLVTSGLLYVGRAASHADQNHVATIASVTPSPSPAPLTTPVATAATLVTTTSGFAALSEQHFERSKLVVLGLANKDPKSVDQADWAYERGLASNLLDDTRLYRMAAEERGLKTIAGVMGDLELVLLQTSMADTPDAQTLDRIQRLIQKRDLVTKMDVATAGS
jgi:anti-sigma factor RsiW